MSDGLMFILVISGFVLIVVLRAVFSARAKRRREESAAAEKERNEALFRSMFPELQPLFHPERLVEFVDARTAADRKGKANARGKPEWDWNNPPGFPGMRAKFVTTEKGERVTLNNPDGKTVGEFLYEAAPAIGVMRVAKGKGKLTIDLSNRPAPRVRYWHPEREFKWSLKGWVFKTAVADEPFSSSSSESGSSSFSSSSSSDSRPAAAAALVGAGGAFDGGGAAGGWDVAPGGGGASDAHAAGASDTPSDSADSASSTAY